MKRGRKNGRRRRRRKKRRVGGRKGKWRVGRKEALFRSIKKVNICLLTAPEALSQEGDGKEERQGV